MGIVVGSLVYIGDNSGAITARCVQVLGRCRVGGYGHFVVVVLKKFNLKHKRVKFRQSGVYRALVLALCVRFQRSFGISLVFERNVVILVNRAGVPISNRIKIPVLFELCKRFPFIGTIARFIL
jgi:ribosomal protein L14